MVGPSRYATATKDILKSFQPDLNGLNRIIAIEWVMCSGKMQRVEYLNFNFGLRALR